jgi:hypothetical protein
VPQYRASTAVSPFLAATIAGEDVILHPGQARELPADDPQVLAWLGLNLIEPAPVTPKTKSRS